MFPSSTGTLTLAELQSTRSSVHSSILTLLSSGASSAGSSSLLNLPQSVSETVPPLLQEYESSLTAIRSKLSAHLGALKSRRDELKELHKDLTEASEKSADQTVADRVASLEASYPSLPPYAQSRLVTVLTASKLFTNLDLPSERLRLRNHYLCSLRLNISCFESVEALCHLGHARDALMAYADTLPRSFDISLVDFSFPRAFKSATGCVTCSESLVSGPVVDAMVRSGALSTTSFTSDEHSRFVDFRDAVSEALGEDRSGYDPFHTNVYYQMRSGVIREEFEEAMRVGTEESWRVVEGVREEIEGYR